MRNAEGTTASVIAMIRSDVDHRLMCEIAGAEYLKTDAGGVVWFKCRESGKVLSLYAFAMRSPDDVKLALKAVREPVEDFAPLLPAEADASSQR